MAEGDNRARQLDTPVKDVLISGDTVKASPIAKPRLPEDAARSNRYTESGQKDVLPEHKARRDRYPLITASS